MTDMELNQGKLAQHLVDQLLEVIYKYEETMYLPTVLGCLDIAKYQLIDAHTGDEEDVDD
jgi:hypothetical protein